MLRPLQCIQKLTVLGIDRASQDIRMSVLFKGRLPKLANLVRGRIGHKETRSNLSGSLQSELKVALPEVPVNKLSVIPNRIDSQRISQENAIRKRDNQVLHTFFYHTRPSAKGISMASALLVRNEGR
jgi:hypothetical protein